MAMSARPGSLASIEEYRSVDDQQMPAPRSVRRADEAPPFADSSGSGRGERISVGSGDENVAKIQLASRWAEQFAPADDNLEAALRRFHRVYTYVDSVTKLVDPPLDG